MIYTYWGGVPVVDLVLADGETLTVARGQTVNVPDDVILGDEWTPPRESVPVPATPAVPAVPAPIGEIGD